MLVLNENRTRKVYGPRHEFELVGDNRTMLGFYDDTLIVGTASVSNSTHRVPVCIGPGAYKHSKVF